MGKLAVAGASAGVVGTGGAATIGAHYMGAFGGGGGANAVDPMYLATTVEEFQKQNGGACLEKLFPGIPHNEKISNKKSAIKNQKQRRLVRTILN